MGGVRVATFWRWKPQRCWQFQSPAEDMGKESSSPPSFDGAEQALALFGLQIHHSGPWPLWGYTFSYSLCVFLYMPPLCHRTLDLGLQAPVWYT